MNRAGFQLALTLAAATAGYSQCQFQPGRGGQILTYTFEPTVTPGETILHVTLKFHGDPATEEEIDVPSEYGGEPLHGVTHLRALSPDTAIVETNLPGVRLVRHRPDHAVVLAYDVVKDWTGRFRHPDEFHAVIMPEYIEVNGANALVHPKLSAKTPLTVYFDWNRLPVGWALATSFGAESPSDSRCQSYSGDWIAVQQALFTAGAFRIHRFQIGARPAVLAIRGEWTFSDDQAIAEIQRAVGIVRDFWHDDNVPYFLVTLKPFDNDSGDGDGSAFTNAFWVYLSRRDSISDALWLLIHETFHEWDPLRMGIPEDSNTIDWFSEGFVRYYSYLLAYRAHAIQLPEYLQTINSELRDVPGSAVGPARGPAIALWLDQQIRRDTAGSSSLDNVMYDMVSGAAKPLTQTRILETAGRYLSGASRAALARAVEPGSNISATEDALAPCGYGSIDEIATFQLGFDLAASKAVGSITGVEPGGPAFQAGLRNGQTLAGRLSVYNNQPEEIAIVTIDTGDGPRAIEYYPRGAPVRLMQYHLNQEAYAANPASCQGK